MSAFRPPNRWFFVVLALSILVQCNKKLFSWFLYLVSRIRHARESGYPEVLHRLLDSRLRASAEIFCDSGRLVLLRTSNNVAIAPA